MQHDFLTPADWEDRPYLFLNLRGTNSRLAITVVVTFSSDASSFAQYTVKDYSDGWRQIALNTAAPEALKGEPGWSHVTGIRLVADKKANATLGFGTLRVAAPLKLGD